MRRYFIFTAIGVAVAFISLQPAGALVADQNGVTKAATATNSIIEVKRHKASNPPGWSHGRKTGWHGSHKPPGQ
jgi:hypothetical protein